LSYKLTCTLESNWNKNKNCNVHKINVLKFHMYIQINTLEIEQNWNRIRTEMYTKINVLENHMNSEINSLKLRCPRKSMWKNMKVTLKKIEIYSFNETNYVQRELTSSQRAHMSENDHWKLGLMVNSHLSTLGQIP
jgi:Zn-dependent metalloprotease